jgi:hypothetical protein
VTTLSNQELFLSFLAPEQDIDWGTDLNAVNFCIPLSGALGEFYQSNSINIRLEKPLADLQASYAERIFRERIENGSFRRPVVISMDNGTQLPDAVLEIVSKKKDLDNFLDNTQFPVQPFVEHMIRPMWVSDDTERFSIAITPETYPGSLSEKVSRFFDVLNSDQLSSEQRNAVKTSIRDLFKRKTPDATKDSQTPPIVADIIDERTDISADALVEAIQHLYPHKDYRPDKDKMEAFQANLYSVMSFRCKEISGLLRRVHYERFCEDLKGQIADFRTRTFWDTLNQGSVLEASKAELSL